MENMHLKKSFHFTFLELISIKTFFYPYTLEVENRNPLSAIINKKLNKGNLFWVGNWKSWHFLKQSYRWSSFAQQIFLKTSLKGQLWFTHKERCCKSYRGCRGGYPKHWHREGVSITTKRLPPDKWSKFALLSTFLNMFNTS